MNRQTIVRNLVILFALGCTEDAEVPANPSSVTDSAGIRIVHVPDLHELDLPEWESRLLYSTANGASQLELFEVADAVFLTDSSLVIADRGSSELFFLDRDGNLTRRVGRKGEGPEEYTDIGRLGLGPDGMLFIYDPSQERMTLLGPQGDLEDVLRVDLGGRYPAYLPLTRLSSGRFLGVVEPRPRSLPLPSGPYRGSLVLVISDSTGQLVDTLGQWPGKERHVTPDGNDWTVVGFGRTALYAGRGAQTVVGRSDSLDLTLYSELRPILGLRGGHSPVPVTASARGTWTERYLAIWPEQVRPRRRRELEQSTIRESYPAFGALAADRGGRIWLGDYVRLDQQQRRWTIFTREGQPIGRMLLPVVRPRWVELEVTIAPYPTHELLDVTSDRIAILRKDEFDVQHVEVREVVKNR